MTLNVTGPKLKLARANRHIRDLENLFETFICDNPHRVEIHENTDDEESPGVAIRVISDSRLPNECATIIGDVAHNLRSALDHLAAVGVRAGGKCPNWSTGFPIYKHKTDFDSKLSVKLDGAPTEFIDFVRDLEAHGENQDIGLFAVAKLNNLDKHDTLIPSVGAVIIPGISVFYEDGTMMGSVEGQRVSGNGVMKIARFSGENLTYKVDGDPTFGVFFREAPILDGLPVVPCLQGMAARCANIVSRAEKLEFAVVA